MLESLPKRFEHVKGVVERAYMVSEFLENDKEFLISAAYLHDIGYSNLLNKNNFHPLDGALYLKSKNLDRLASLVAYHSSALFEAELRGFSKQLKQFEKEDSLIDSALTYCDMTTNSEGKQVSFKDRLDNIFSRYDKSTIVYAAMNKSLPKLENDVKRIENLMKK